MQRTIQYTSVTVGLLVAVGLLSQTGCAVFMAARQPPKKDLSVLQEGTARSLVLAELGQPVATETRDGRRMDVFAFVQGYSKGAKAGRALFHGAADVFTLGLWEVVGTPTEAVFDGSKKSFEVTYDENDRVLKVVDLKPAPSRPSQDAAKEETPAASNSKQNFSPR